MSQHNLPQTPGAGITLPLDSAHAEAAEKIAKAMEALRKAGDSPALKGIGRDLERRLASLDAGMRRLSSRSEQFGQGMTRGAEAALRAGRSLQAQYQAASAAALRAGDNTRGAARDLIAAGVAARVLGTGSRAMADSMQRQAATAQIAARALGASADARKAETTSAARSVARMGEHAADRLAAARAKGGDRLLGREQSRRQREQTALSKDDARRARVESDSYSKTIAKEDRGESPGADVKGVGSMKATYAAAGADARLAMASAAGEANRRALEAMARRRAMRNYKPDAESGVSGHDLYHREQFSRWQEMEQAGKLRAFEAREQARYELGGEGAPGAGNRLFGGDRAAALQARQRAAYDAAASDHLADQVLAAQRLLEYRKRAAGYEQGDEGQALLARKAQLGQQSAGAAAWIDARRERLDADRMATPEGRADADRLATGQRENEIQLLRKSAELEEARQRAVASSLGRQALAEELKLRERIAVAQRSGDLEEQAARLARGGTTDGRAAAQQALSQAKVKELGDLQEQLASQRELERFYRSPAGAKQAQAAAKTQKDLERASRAAERAQVKARWGGGLMGDAAVFGNEMGKGFAQANEQLSRMADAGQRAFAAITGGMLAAASVADPFVTWPTAVESAKAVMIELGAIAKPVIDDVSGKLQGAAAWIRGLSDATKLWGLRVAVWVAAGGLMVSTIYKAIIAVRALTVAVGSLNAATGVGLLSLAAGAVAALSAEYFLLGERASTAAHAVGEVAGAAGLAGKSKRSDSGITADEMGRLPADVRARVQAAAGHQGRMLEALVEFQRKTAADLDKAKAAQVEPLGPAQARDDKYKRLMPPELQAEAQAADRRRLRLVELTKDANEEGTFTGAAGRALRRIMSVVPVPNPVDVLEAASRDDQEKRDAAARSLTASAMRRAREQGVTTFKEEGMAPEEVRRRKAAGEFGEEEIRSRILADLQGFRQARDVDTLRVTRGMGAELLRLEERKKLADDLVKKTGADQTKTAEKWPVQPAITDHLRFADQLQIQALQGGDLQADNLRRQLEIANGQLDELKEVNENLVRLLAGGGAQPGQGARAPGRLRP